MVVSALWFLSKLQLWSSLVKTENNERLVSCLVYSCYKLVSQTLYITVHNHCVPINGSKVGHLILCVFTFYCTITLPCDGLGYCNCTPHSILFLTFVVGLVRHAMSPYL